MISRPRVAIVTNFTGCDMAFSLVVVVKTQLQMLHAAGYRPILVVSEAFTEAARGVYSGSVTEIRRAAHYDAPTDEIAASLRRVLADVDVALCHDLVFLSNYRAWGEAVRSVAAEGPRPGWVHWQHSRGDHIVEAPCPHSWYAYPNRGDLPHVAGMNKADLDRVRYIPHPLDFDYLGWPELAIQIAEDTGFPWADVSAVLPTRMDRQKQVERAVRLMAGIKKAGKSVCFIVADAFATGERFLAYEAEISAIAAEQGLADSEFVFLSRYDECKYSTPRPVVKALYEMSNLFIQPSNAETSSLIVMEAALAGALPVINADFPPIHHLYAKALSLPFGSVISDTRYFRHITSADGSMTKVEDAQLFFDDQARQTVIPALDSQLAQAVKRQQLRERWPSRVFRDYIEPLILEACPPRPALAAHGDPDVTAIITTLDNCELLQEQVPILLAECGHVIVVNNGSRDGTREWLEENNIAGLSYINRENKGAGPGRNAGLDLWAGSTPYTLMVDGGILPPVGAVAMLKCYLEQHSEAAVISPEVASCFTTDRDAATLIAPPLPDDPQCFWQRCLSSTAFCLCRAEAWAVRFSEEGPFGEPGWGVDDNDMAYRWDAAEIVHHEFTNEISGWKLYRRKSGSFQRLFEETGIWPSQYGSVYEQRNVKCLQDWRQFHGMLYGRTSLPAFSYVIQNVLMPDFARLVKRLHEGDRNCEIVVQDDYDPEVKWWLDTFYLRWEHGNTTIDPDGRILRRDIDYPEELWSGNVVRNRGPLVEPTIITPENIGDYFVLAAAAS